MATQRKGSIYQRPKGKVRGDLFAWLAKIDPKQPPRERNTETTYDHYLSFYLYLCQYTENDESLLATSNLIRI